MPDSSAGRPPSRWADDPTASAGEAATEQEVLSALLRRSARGDEAAFADLYDRIAPRVYGLVLSVVRDRAQAEEVAQESLLDIWTTSARYDARQGSSAAWMLTIAHRRAVDRVRSSQAQRLRDARYDAATHDPPRDLTAEGAERSLDRERVRHAMQQLTTTQREAIELAYFGGYTHTEVARLLDLPLGTAKTRIRDGMIRLRDTLGLQS